MRIAFLSPLPPVKSGIAGISAMLLPRLSRRIDVTAVSENGEVRGDMGCPVISLDEYRRREDEFDRVVYQLGNNPYHEWIYLEALRRPGVAVFHDAVMHHLIVEMTLARGDVDGFIRIMRENHGEAGAAWAEARAAGWHTELSNFLYPASVTVGEKSELCVVHNRFAEEMLRRCGVTTPIRRIDLPLADAIEVAPGEREALREELGYGAEHSVVGMFGFVTEAKRPEIVFEAFSHAHAKDRSLRLLVVGEPAPSVHLEEIAARFALSDGSWKATGYVSDEQFERYLAAVDRVVSLRYPSAGETSGAILRIFQSGKAVAVNDYAHFSELPEDLVTRIPFGEGEVAALSDFMVGVVTTSELVRKQQTWVARHADVERVADAYVSLLTSTPSPRLPRIAATVALELFPVLEIEAVSMRGSEVKIDLRNQGDATLRCRVYGEPSYRLVAHHRRGGRTLSDHWLTLTSDLQPESRTTLSVTLPQPVETGDEIAFWHALEGIPQIDSEPFHTRSLA